MLYKTTYTCKYQHKILKFGQNWFNDNIYMYFNINLIVLFPLLVNDLVNYSLGNILPLTVSYNHGCP